MKSETDGTFVESLASRFNYRLFDISESSFKACCVFYVAEMEIFSQKKIHFLFEYVNWNILNRTNMAI